ncbi:hypothetical protein LLI86_001568, partial [Acinetobacter baumannii]
VKSYLAQWLIDLGTIFSIIGFFITIWLLWEAKQLRKSFFRRARLPEVIENLTIASSKLSSHLKKWETEDKEAIHQLSICKAVIENVTPKLPDNAQKKCKIFVKSVTPTTFLIWTFGSSDIDKDKAWDLYALLSEVVTMLQELEKDLKWD